LSSEFAHPLPALADGEKVGADNVGTAPVGVYEGRSVTAPPLLMLAGGQARLAETLAGI